MSDDAGRYLCDYIYYASLAHFHATRKREMPWDERTHVVFLHVPPVTHGSVEDGREVAVALIRALVDSRRMRQDDYRD